MESLGALVARTVRDHPDRIAVDLGVETVTYQALWDAAGAIATSLARSGVTAAGLLATGDARTFAGYLGALRAGAAVVPLQPKFPVARTLSMVEAAGVGVVLACDAVEPDLAAALAGAGVTVLGPSDIGCGNPVGTGAEGDAVAYILFTSGSTGVPKGVPISHRSALAYVAHNIERCEVAPGSRLSHTFDLTFDPSVFDLFAAWGAGATLTVPTGHQLVNPVRYVRERGITHWFSVPSAVGLARTMRALRPGAMPDLRWSMFIGEQLTWDQVDAWRTAAPATVVDNVYGPTELTVACSAYRVPADRAAWPPTSNGTVPIGAVYPHLESRVLDGELCVRGVQRFGGYLDPAQNADRFVAVSGAGTEVYDGATPLTAAHWYRTGDRVRTEHGEVVHLGRLDRQVQLAGCRVELGEVEAALRRHDAVVDAVAVVGADQRTLSAFYTGTAVGADELRRALRAQLPGNLVPVEFAWLPSLPLNDNGKVDRRRLPVSGGFGAGDPVAVEEAGNHLPQ
jgi:amino acid adenylation domain-containing protein